MSHPTNQIQNSCPSWMIYGASGYTGKLIAQETKKEGKTVVLAGRNALTIESLARTLGMPFRVFGLESVEEIRKGIQGIELVLNCAGPFSLTAKALVAACMEEGVHYLDITGEIEVFELLASLDSAARAKGVMLLPGMGFDVVPSDCLAKALSEHLKTPTQLELAFYGGAGMSRGTLKTMLRESPKGGRIRRDGKIISVPFGYQSKEVVFSEGKRRLVTSIPWGDVSTAFYSTGIPNIITYGSLPKFGGWVAPVLRYLLPILKNEVALKAASFVIDRSVGGPSEEDRKVRRMHLWGRVQDGEGSAIEGTLDIPEGYAFTSKVARQGVKEIFEGKVSPGFKTPSMVFGHRWVNQFEGVKSIIS